MGSPILLCYPTDMAQDVSTPVLARSRGHAPHAGNPTGTTPDLDRVVEASVNAPFSTAVDAGSLARAIRADLVPDGYAPHLARFLGELPLDLILRFCDLHAIETSRLARFVRHRRRELVLWRPELDEHLDALVPGS
ncbi:MAG TPA: hypothetical protein VFY87_10205 [Geminicoccaceae bacterium]|jgi:hypothetical protein|nr:hypothetical protein [Geminicoccaceae bacterium]